MDMVDMHLLVEWEGMECLKDHLPHLSLVAIIMDNHLPLGVISTLSSQASQVNIDDN